jgi:hypothetical protein
MDQDVPKPGHVAAATGHSAFGTRTRHPDSHRNLVLHTRD